MRLGGWMHKKVDIADEQVWLTRPCSDKFASGLLAMVGGEIHVTSAHIIFTPNYLGVLVGRKPWSYPIADISEMHLDFVELGSRFGTAAALQVTIPHGSDAANLTKTLVMHRGQNAEDVLGAIEQQRRRP
jgi:hypothetical protein